MPAPPAVPSVLKVIWRQQVGDDAEVGTRLYFTYTGSAPSDATCLLIAEQMWLAYSNYLTPLLSSDNALQGVDVIDLTSSTAGAAEYLARSAGTASPADLTAATCLLVNASILRRYRGGKPRSYWPFGVAADLTNPSEWSTAFLTAAQTALDTFLAHCVAIVESGTTVAALVNVSFYESFLAVENPITHRWRNVPLYRTGAIPVDLVTGYVVNAKPGTQRRRQLHSS